ncbi:uncharacterized protein EI97DRAFT_457884 [Westerdykella ornata]|uniref:Zn(2)-C6 fungal-type domain-containing protein n=1 Tax=Westerdykella ornata TaxID=318751 RepID=A0A6A6JM33_WESOR|nr:uncharacterized protein EI97DRAFT_457884 [Westerdykella ornata]KAF2277173.1 hypothetical protein EI97DRAFT_457884 [Westerdykella ornata]
MTEAPNPRRKSCSECVKAKRKCGMEVPRCGRCSKKDIACFYPNKGASIADVPIPELEFAWLDDLMREPGSIPWSGGLDTHLELSADAIHSQQSHVADITSLPELFAVSEEFKKTTLPKEDAEAAVARFKTWPDKWLKEGKVPFIHAQLYATNMPKPLMDAYAACAIYSTITPANKTIALDIIEAKANELLRSPNQPFWTPVDLLASTQSLIIFQFIRLFDGDIRQRFLAESAEPTLLAWTRELQSRTAQERQFTTATAPSWRAWLFAESARRTITMSLFLTGLYSLIKKGYCTVADEVTANCFTAQRALWEATSELEWARTKQTLSPHWIENMDFTHMLREAEASELDDFGMVLLITYHGQDAIDYWAATKSIVGVPNFHQSLEGVLQFGNG